MFDTGALLAAASGVLRTSTTLAVFRTEQLSVKGGTK